MQADFSRWTFDGHAGFRSVLLQQGRVLLDADWNEQTQITAHHDEVRTQDVVGRSGAPVGDAAFGIVDGTGAAPAGTAWADLRLTPGRFYVDGVLVTVAAPGATLADQPYLPAGPELPGLPEEDADGRYALVLEAFSHHVTADEAPRLRESALGGPDTTTRERTVWQVRIAAVDDGQVCAGPHPWLDYSAPTMTAALEDVPPGSDPCRITSAAGYRRLENQLYRVQIHTTGSGGATYLWSRENASVVAALLEIGTTVVTGMDAELRLDREGRDEELSIQEGDIVEVTSVDRQLHGLPGFLAVAGAPDGLRLPVNWSGAAPPGLTELGDVPLVRRWEGGPTATSATAVTLEDGIQVSFGTGDFRVGDHWLIPARTVRLVYGASALAGHDRVAGGRRRAAAAAAAGTHPPSRHARPRRACDGRRRGPLEPGLGLPASVPAAHADGHARPARRRRAGGAARRPAAAPRTRRRAQRRRCRWRARRCASRRRRTIWRRGPRPPAIRRS